MDKFLRLAGKDKRVLALHKALDKGSYHIDLISTEKEIDNLHLSRKIRNLKTVEIMQSFQKLYLDCALQNQAYRSRLVEIKVKCFRMSAKLEEHISVVKGYLAVQYPNSLRNYKTIGERKAAIDSVLERPITFLKQLELKDIELDTVIKDIDAAAWAMKGIMDAMNTTKDIGAKF